MALDSPGTNQHAAVVAGDREISASILGTFNLGEGRFSGLNEAIHAVVLGDRIFFQSLHIRKKKSRSRKEEAHSHPCHSSGSRHTKHVSEGWWHGQVT